MADLNLLHDQYWIKYTITDGSGKSSSKKQKIVFEKLPSEDKAIDFEDERCAEQCFFI